MFADERTAMWLSRVAPGATAHHDGDDKLPAACAHPDVTKVEPRTRG